MTDLLNKVNSIVPTYPGEVPEDARLPYAFYASSDRPILTKDGVAGYEGDMTLSIVSPVKKTSRGIADRVITAINGKSFGRTTAFLTEVTDDEDLEQGLYMTTVIFNTLSQK